MSDLSHLFVSATKARWCESLRTVTMTDATTEKEVVLYENDIDALIKNWTYYAEEGVSSLEEKMFTFSDEVQGIFSGLQKHLAAGSISNEYTRKQNIEFGVALNALKKLKL